MNPSVIDHCIFNALAQTAWQHAYSPQYTLLATACITPPIGTRGLVRASPELRLRDYIEALSKSLKIEDSRIGKLVLLENSGFSASRLGKLITERAGEIRRDIEVISYLAPQRPEGVHYGYSEFQMIDDLMDRSIWLSSKFIKITGRYWYPDISLLLDKIPTDIKFAFDSVRRPALPPFLKNPARSADIGIFVASKDFYDTYVRRLYLSMAERPRFSHIEDRIFDSFVNNGNYENLICRFPVNCEPAGFGGNGDDLRAMDKKIKSAVRALARRVVPDFWI